MISRFKTISYPLPLSQTCVSSSGDTLISSKMNRPTRTTSVSTRRAPLTIPSRASRARTACWTTNTDCNIERCPVQTRVFSICQLPLLFLTSIFPCLFAFSLVFPHHNNLTIIAAKDVSGVVFLQDRARHDVENVSSYRQAQGISNIQHRSGNDVCAKDDIGGSIKKRDQERENEIAKTKTHWVTGDCGERGGPTLGFTSSA